MPVKLWNDYEGKIIAEAYPLKKLLRPEGRSAFFMTTAQDGGADVIRITESLNDEHEMLERWRQVSQVHQANLVEIKTYGTTTFDGVPLTYALMEATDASLAEILKERPLTAAETMQVATSILAALTALHAIDFIHEHIEPASIVASGEVIKLRSDCVRECIVDPEFNPKQMCDELRQRDVHDYAVLLLQCLTLERQPSVAVPLPSPFDRIVRHGLDGTWGLAEIERTLHPPAEKPLVPAAVLANSRQGATPEQRASLAAGDGAATAPGTAPKLQGTASTAGAEASLAGSVRRVEPSVPTMRRRLHLRRLVTKTSSLDPVPKRWFLAGSIALAVVLFVWFFVARSSDAPHSRPASLSAGAPAISAPAPALEKAEPAPAAKPVAAEPAPMQPGWHVIAYTYLHEGQAAAKAAWVARRYPGLAPKVFAPAGHSPYFVALGGGMSESEAAAVLRMARKDGLPRDTFIRLYRSR